MIKNLLSFTAALGDTMIMQNHLTLVNISLEMDELGTCKRSRVLSLCYC